MEAAGGLIRFDSGCALSPSRQTEILEAGERTDLAFRAFVTLKVPNIGRDAVESCATLQSNACVEAHESFFNRGQ